MMLKLDFSKRYDVNYLVKVVNVNEFHDHPGADALKIVKVDGFSVIVGKDEKCGMYLYFPTNCEVNPELLAYAGLYRKNGLNKNPEVSGFFEENGRVKAIKLRGEVSEGFLLPVQVFKNFCIDNVNQEPEGLEDGKEFDVVRGDEDKSFWIVKKYIPKGSRRRQRSGTAEGPSNVRYKVPKRLKKIIDTQFRFHYQTVLIKKCPHVISPSDWISITKKVDGTSGVSAYVLCKRDLTWWEKGLKWVGLMKEDPLVYDYVYSSRTVIKNPYYNPGGQRSFYGEVGGDVWKYADEYLRPFLEKGMTFYYEIVGFLPNGKFIQKNNDFGMTKPAEGGEYIHGKHFRTLIYRITLTNADGIVHEFSPHEVQVWCKEKGLEPVHCFYEGYAKDLYPDLKPEEHWTENFMARLAADKNFNMEELEPECKCEVPAEGIVIKKDNLKSEAFKLKTFYHLNRKQMLLDKGETDIEA